MLGDLQHKFKEAILRGEKVRLNWIAENPPLSRVDRLDIYSYAYFARLTDGLREDFGILAEILGPDHFDAIAKDFFGNHPSRFSSANEVNRPFPDFVAQHSDFQESPALVDLARFEWLLVEAFFGRDLERTGADEMVNATSADWERAHLILDPSVQLLESSWDLIALTQGKKVSAKNFAKKKQTYIVIHRINDHAQWQTVGEGQFTLLTRLSRNLPLKEALTGLDAEEFGPEIFADWWNEGVIRSIDWHSTPLQSSHH